MRPPADVSPLLRPRAYTLAGVLFTLKLAVEARAHALGDSAIRIDPSTFGVMLLTLAAFLVVAKALTITTATSHAAHVLRSRVLDAGQNWQSDPTRSFIELFACVSVIWSTYAVHARIGLSLLCGVLSSLVIICCGELVTRPLREFEETLMRSWDAPTTYAGKRVGCSMGVLALYAWSGVGLIYAHVSDIALASALATTMLVAILLAARVITAFPPTRRVGEILQDRILRSAPNWAAHPLRSAFELSACTGVCVLTYGLHGSPVFALQAGATAGMLSVLYTELALLQRARAAAPAAARKVLPYVTGTLFAFCMCSPREMEQRLVDVVSPM